MMLAKAELGPRGQLRKQRKHVQRVNDAGDVTQDSEENVDQEVGIAAALEEHTERGQEDGEDDLDDIAATGQVSGEAQRGDASSRGAATGLPSGERHGGGSLECCGW